MTQQEWIQLPVISMRDRLEQVFRLVEAGLVSTTFPAVPNQLEIITDRQQQQQSFDSLEIDCVMPIIGQPPLLEPETVTTAAAHQLLLPALLDENQKVATNNCISPPPIIKDEVVGAGVKSASRTSSSSSAISTAVLTKSAAAAAAAQQRPLKMVKSIVERHSTTSTTGHQFDGGLTTGPYSSIAFRNNNAGRTTITNNDELSAQVVVNQVDWNETDSPPATAAVYSSQKSYSLLMGRQSTSGTSSPNNIIGLKENDDGLLDEMAITLDTPCPSASNSRSGSCSSTSSISSCTSQQQESSGIDPYCAGGSASSGIDEQFLRTCSDAASLVTTRDNGSRGPSALKSGTASTSLNLNRRTITARVRFVQPQPTTAGGARHHPGDPVDLQCCLITPPPPPNS